MNENTVEEYTTDAWTLGDLRAVVSDLLTGDGWSDDSRVEFSFPSARSRIGTVRVVKV